MKLQRDSEKIAGLHGVTFQVVAKIVAVRKDNTGVVGYTAPASPVIVLKETDDLFEAMFAVNFLGDRDGEKLPNDTMVPVAQDIVRKIAAGEIKWKKERSK